MAPVARPETVLKRADTLLSLSQPLSALHHLSLLFSTKKFRTTPLPTLEPILQKYLELCIQLRKPKAAKEALHAFKNVGQNVNPGSVESIVRGFLEGCEGRLEQAWKEYEKEVEGLGLGGEGGKEKKEDGEEEEEIEDLDSPSTPEQLLNLAFLAPVTSPTTSSTQSKPEEPSSQPSDPTPSAAAPPPPAKTPQHLHRALVTPWMRFCWEAYRSCLDVLRNNSRIEGGYLMVATRALKFLLHHRRRTEFRRLSEILRAHLTSALKYSHQSHAIDLTNQETLTRLVEIRFGMLDGAMAEGMEMWGEGYRIGEDLWGLLERGGATAVALAGADFVEKPTEGKASKERSSSSISTSGIALLSTFYTKMSKIFLVGENMLFHSACYAKLLTLSTSAAEDRKIAEKMLVSALAAPLVSKELENTAEGGKEHKAKGGKTVGLSGVGGASNVTRDALLREVLARSVLKRVSPQLAQLYNLIEPKSALNPLTLVSSVSPLLSQLQKDPDLKIYVPHLKKVITTKLFQQLRGVYQVVRLKRVIQLATFKVEGLEQSEEEVRKEVEGFLTEGCRKRELAVYIDHATDEVRFEAQIFSEDPLPSSSSSAVIQVSPAMLLRTRLSNLATVLEHAVNTISHDDSPFSRAIVARDAAFEALTTQIPIERTNLLNRKKIIARRKEVAEELAARRVQEEAHNTAVRVQARQDEEARRLREGVKKAELERIRKEAEQIRVQEAINLVKNLEAKGGIKVDISDIKDLDSAKVVQLQVEQVERERKELSDKLRVVTKRMDHYERALRREERPLLEKDYERQQVRDRVTFDQARRDLVSDLKAKHESDLSIKKRLVKVKDDYVTFRTRIEDKRKAEFEKATEKSRQRIEAEKQKKREEVLEKKKADRRREREEAARRQREEEEEAERERERQEREVEEEAARKAIEERRAQMAEEAAEARRIQKEKDTEFLEKQRRREQEAEQRAEQRRLEKDTAKVSTPAAAPAAPSGVGAWRRETPASTTTTTAEEAPTEKRPPVLGSKPGGWRERQEAKKDESAAGTSPAVAAVATNNSGPPSRSESPALGGRPSSGAWKPRLRNESTGFSRTESPGAGSGESALQPRPLGGGGSSWRDRERAKAAQEPDADGFLTARKPQAYRPPPSRK